MKFKEFYLSEAPHYTDEEPQSSNYVIHGRYNKYKNQRSKTIEYKEYKILRTYGYTKTSFEWFVFLNDVLVANISSEYGLDKKYKFPITTLVLVSPEYRNRGIAKDIYDYLLNYYGGVVSSRFLSKTGGMLLWKSLVKKYNSYEYFEDGKINKIDSIPEESMSDQSTRLIISKKELT